MPNPNHDPDTGQFTSPPQEPAAPDYSSFAQAGITPEMLDEITNARNLYQGLNNLNTRQQYLDQLIQPFDGYSRAQAEQQDPWAGYADDGEDEGYYEPQPQQPPPFDPRSLQPVFEGYGEQIEQRIMGRLTSMARDQAIEDATAGAVREAGLPPSFSRAIQAEVDQVTNQYANRQPADVAREVAARFKADIAAYHAASAAPPAQTPGPPPADAPVPGDAEPKTWEDAMRWSRDNLPAQQ